MKRLLTHFRTRFLAGIAVVVPAIATFLALRFLFRQLDGIFSAPIAQVVGREVPGLGIVATALLVLVVGYVVTNLLGRRLVTLGESVVARVPLARTIYKASRDIVQAATVSRSLAFREVVVIEYPRKGAFSYGFVTSYTTRNVAGNRLRLANIFIPGPPVPTTGVLIALPVEELVYLDLSVEDALKLVLSAGVAAPAELRERVVDSPR